MSRIFLINVGANLRHSSIARSPIFNDDRFIFVSYPHNDEPEKKPYPLKAQPFVRVTNYLKTHVDPDWNNLTYGDYCANPRAVVLRGVVPGDILLFWALLWRNTGTTWNDFTGDRWWYLIGALRVSEILKEGQTPKDAKPSNIKRAAENAHFTNNILAPHNYVFIGSRRYSSLFPKAVDFYTNDSHLMFRTVKTANGETLEPKGGTRWSSSTRACRAVWNLTNPEQRSRAEIVRDAILQKTDYDLLKDIEL